MGEALCRLDDLERTGARGVTLGQGASARELVVVRDGSVVRAYENRCPHLGMPLETLPDRFLDAAGEHLVCTTHGARFAVGDGYCVSGPCRGARLQAVAIEIEAGIVRLAAAGSTGACA